MLFCDTETAFSFSFNEMLPQLQSSFRHIAKYLKEIEKNVSLSNQDGFNTKWF